MFEPAENQPRRNLLADAVDRKPPESIKGYTRAVRRKLYFLFAMLILVLILMKEARKPANWMWMGFDAPANHPGTIQLDGESNSQSDDELLENEDPVGSISTASDSGANDSRNSIAGGVEFWDELWTSLETEDRTALVELIQLSQKRLDQRDVNLADFDPLVSTISKASPADPAYRQKWDQTIKPGFIAVASGEDLTIGQQTALKELFETLDPLILGVLDDFTSPGRKSDMPAWHRFWGRVLEEENLDSATTVSPVQLVAQPDVWRFQPVRVRGKLLAGRMKPAGIHGPLRHKGVWYEWWIGNTRGADEVWCIYTADKPDSINVTETFSDFNLPIECSGLFYKVRSYVDAQSKGNHCPLILANTLTVKRKSNPIAEATWTPTITTMVACIVGVMGIAFVVAMMVHRSDRKTVHTPGGEYKRQIDTHLESLSDDPDIKSVAERLEELS